MSKELLLNIETSSVSAASKQTPASVGDSSDSIGFSLALDEQITAQSSTTEPALPTADQQVNTQDKTENIAVESGKNSPVSVEVTTQWLQQLLPSAEPSALDDLAEQLTEFIAPLLEQVNSGELSDHDAAIQIEQWMQQLGNLQQQGVSKNTSEASDLINLDSLAEQLKSLDLPPEVTEKLTQFLQTVTGQATTSIAQQRSVIAADKPVQQTQDRQTIANLASPQSSPEQKVNSASKAGTQQPLASTTTSIAAVNAAEDNNKASQVNTASADKVTRIAELVKQVIPVQQTETAQVKSTTEGVENTTSERSQRVAELVQSLTRQGSKETAMLKPEANITTMQNTTTPMTQDTKLARIAQLVAALTPSLKEDVKAPSVADKASPVTTTAASTLSSPAPSIQTMKVAPTLDIQPTLQNEAWNRVLTSRVIWLASEGIQQASLKLNPANLGPVEVRLAMHNEQTHVTFVAAQTATREALEQALPRLRESFAENGLELGNANVSEQTSQQANDQRESDDNTNGFQERDLTIQPEQQVSEQAAGIEQDIELGVNVYA